MTPPRSQNPANVRARRQLFAAINAVIDPKLDAEEAGVVTVRIKLAPGEIKKFAVVPDFEQCVIAES